MLKVGLTGGIGAGKSVVAKIFDIIGIPVYIADIEAKRLINTDVALKAKLIESFGKEIYKNNFIDKKVFAHIIFNKPDALALVNSLVHPVLRNDFNKWASNNKKAPYLIQESAILFESGSNKFFDIVICVTADIECRIQRAMDRDNCGREKILERIKNQISEDEKLKKSDYEIKNSISDMLIEQVLEIDKLIKEKI